MVFIVIPLYNKGDVIQRTLDSLFSQTYQDFEVLIVNDGSVDNTQT
jgi:glycosyltransferase involved in cell wall biosynthesis